MEFVTFEIAKRLKEKGFRMPCIAHYNSLVGNVLSFNTTEGSSIRESNVKCLNNCNIYTDAPTISQVLKWLREEKNIVVSMHPHYHYGKGTNTYWRWDAETPVYTVDMPTNVKQNDFGSYEQAALAGIEYVLNLI